MKRHMTSLLIIALLMPLAAGAQPPAQRQGELQQLLRQDCGSCHGMTLKGGLGPALTPEALAGKPFELLVNSIIYGRPGTPMPPWEGLLTREEAQWLVEQLQEGL